MRIRACLFASMLATACGAAPAAAPPPPAPTAKPAPEVCAASPEPFKVLSEASSTVTYERMARYPEPGWQVPRSVALAPDGTVVTFLQSEHGDQEMSLQAFDLVTKQTRVLLRAGDLAEKAKLSPEEELRRERQRQRIEGITGYSWAEKAAVMVIPHAGDVFVRGVDGAARRLTKTPEPEIDPQLCASGERVAFVRGAELVSVDVKSGKETALTTGARPGVTRGQTDFNGQEEFDELHGFFWSPRCDAIAYLEVDERGVEPIPVLGYREGRAEVMQQRYPLTGAKNPSVRLGIVQLGTKQTKWVELPKGAGESYLLRPTWSPDGASLWLQALSRDQKTLRLLRADPRKGTTSEVLSETSPAYVEAGDLRLLTRAARFVWSGIIDGHRHLTLRDANTGAPVRALTAGDWDVTALAAVDEQRGTVSFVSTKDSALQRQLYTVALEGGEPKRVTTDPGVHAVTMRAGGGAFVDVHSAHDRLPRADVYDTNGAPFGALPSLPDADLGALGLRAPELVEVPTPDGTTLHGALLAPRNLQPGARHPALIVVYGGPGFQSVLDDWQPRLLWQHLADRGFFVLQVDNRGSTGRGAAFAQATYGALGALELADQLAALGWLVKRPDVDEARVGIYGHSYGGFMALLAMLKAPGRFAVGIAGSPATDFRTYDTGYTERYAGLPATNAAGYDATDLTRLAPALTGHLLVMHALMDENVHFVNTARLIDALVAADKPFDLLVFPGERHGYRSSAARKYAMRRVVEYLAAHL